MQATEQAQQMFQSVMDGVNILQNTLHEKKKFSPQIGPHVFRVGMSDYSETILLPKLLKHLKEIDANIQIKVEHIHPDKRHEALQDGGVDLNVHGTLPGLQSEIYGCGIVQRLLLEDQHVFVVGKEFVPPQEHFSLKELASLPHARYESSMVIDKMFAEKGLQRNVVFQVPHVLVLPQLVVGSPLVATLPRRLATHFSKQLPLRVVTPPQSLPSLNVHMYWHERHKKSPSHIWLRDTIKQLMA